MTKEILESYRSKKEEIQELQYKIDHLGEGDSMVGNDVILNYTKGYPIPQSVVGVDWDKVYRTEGRYKARLKELQRECAEIEGFVETIQDSLIRRIFRMRFIDGLPQRLIARKVHLDQSQISRKIDIFIKDA